MDQMVHGRPPAYGLVWWVFDFDFKSILTLFLIPFDPFKPTDRALHIGAPLSYKIYEEVSILKE